MEDQAAVLEEMRVLCDVKIRKEERDRRRGRAGTPSKSSSSATTTTATEVTHSTFTNAASNDLLPPPGLAKWEENEEPAGRDETAVENEERGIVKENGSSDGYCPMTFDDIYCWPRTPPDTTVAIQCPGYIKNFMRGVSESVHGNNH